MPNDFMARLRARCRARGFTLVELMVSIGVAAILAMVAVPTFRNIILSNRLTTAANAMVDAINVARIDAIKLNATTQFCSNNATSNFGDALGSACTTQAGAVYALPQSAGTAGQVRAANNGLNSTIRVASAGITAIRFSGQGLGYNANGGTPNTPYSGTVADLCTPSLAADNHRIINMIGGSIVATASSTGNCP